MSLIKKIFLFSFCLIFSFGPILSVQAQTGFDRNFIISDAEMQDTTTMTQPDIQAFLQNRGSYLANYQALDSSGTPKMASQIIYQAAQDYQINPKFLLVTLQKEQSLVIDDAPTMKQLDWAAGFAVCDSCSMDDPKVVKFKGFGLQVASAAGIIRWYYDNKETKDYIKKKDAPITIDNSPVIPGSWATAFLYTYTPHLHGNENFWRIWQNWFSQVYPNGSLLQSPSTTDIWLLENGQKRRFTSRTALITRADPRLVIQLTDGELNNYPTGPEIMFANYSILKSPSGVYLLDYDTLRPFDVAETVGKLGFNPQEVIDVGDDELASYKRGTIITASSTPPQGVIYQITDLNNAYFILRDGTLYPINDKRIVEVNFGALTVEKHNRSYLAKYTIAGEQPITFKDGTLLRAQDSTVTYVVENGKKRRIADKDTFLALGYKAENIVTIDGQTLFSLPEGEQLFINSALVNARNKFLGDSLAPVPDLFATKVPAYLVAEYPNGRILTGKNLDTPRPMASLTKLIIAYEAFDDNFKNTTPIVFSSKKFTATNSLKLKNGEVLKRIDMLNVALVDSVNNAAEMLALSSGLSKQTFIANANDRLKTWGADNTTVADLPGLAAGSKSTPRDLLKIFTKVTNDPSLKKILGKTSYSFSTNLGSKQPHYTVPTTNKLALTNNKLYKVIASKTGFTDEARANLIMLIEVTKTKKQYIVITMANPNINNRFAEPNRLAEWVATNNLENK